MREGDEREYEVRFGQFRDDGPVAREIGDVALTVYERYAQSRERSMVLTKLEEALLWAGRAPDAEVAP